MMMITLAIGAVVFEAANKATWLTGGDNGLEGVSFDPVLGLFPWNVYGQTSYLYVLAWLFLLFVLMRRVVGSPFGVALQGVRENPGRMRLIGSPVVGQLVRAYMLGAFFAGVAGALSTETTNFVGLDVVAIDLSVNVLIMVVLGGVGSLYGGLIGAPIYMGVKEFVASMNPYNWMFFIGLMLVIVVRFGRGGIMGAADQGLRLIRRRAEAPPP
jgi:branched-chain amino acid transport system permease protein